MQIGHIRVQNYRGLRDVEASFSSFACIIGENNAGKSSLLQAFAIFLKKTRLAKTDFYDESEPIAITVRFDDVADNDLAVLAENHRTRIRRDVHDGSLTFVRRYLPSGSSELLARRLVPEEERFLEASYNEGLKGKNRQQVRQYLTVTYPELGDETIGEVAGITAAKTLLKDYVGQLPKASKIFQDEKLSTGIENSVSPIFPDAIYVPAVKDLSDEVKTTQSATFGKLISILLSEIESELGDLQGWFNDLDKRLNRTVGPDDTIVDERITGVQDIESDLEFNLRETFANVNVELRIPPPEFKTIFQGADIEIDDGVRGSVDTKGDGLRRAATFAILRSYVRFSKGSAQPDTQRVNEYLFLFEEPELYLHPVAQVILFDALSLIARRHQVIISTHSPFFFRPDNTDKFIKVKKETAHPKPIGVLAQIDLTDMSDRDLFQIISFENNNSAFFARKVLLVEGESELIALPHIARILDDKWDFAKSHIALVKTGGKGNIQRFRQFFDRFDIEVSVVADLDILTDGFEKLGVQGNVAEMRSQLIQKVDALVNSVELVSAGNAKNTMRRGDQHALWEQVRNDYRAYKSNETLASSLVDSLTAFMERLRKVRRIDILRENCDSEIIELKRGLLLELRKERIYIWENGCLDDYYPDSVQKNDAKPVRAHNFRRQIASREDILSKTNQIRVNGNVMSEFELVFSSIFGETSHTENTSDEQIIE